MTAIRRDLLAQDLFEAQPARSGRDEGSRPADSRLLVAASLFLVYLATSFLLPRFFAGGWNLYFAQPLLWLGLGALCLRLDRSLLRRPRAALIGLALLAGLFQVAVLLLAGLVYGFGSSTFAHSPLAIAGNLAYLGCYIWGLEAARAYLLARGSGAVRATMGVALLFAALGLTTSQWQTLLGGGRPAFEVAGSDLLPAAAASLVATVLVAAAGPWAGIAYHAVPLLFEWLSPALPHLDWTVAAFFGLVAPAAALLAVQSALAPPSPNRRAETRRGVPAWLLGLGCVFVLTVWLNSGLLGVRPFLVSGVSMEPNLVLGDIILTRDVAPASLREGDVIRFSNGGVSIVHRVKAVMQTPAGLVFQTQGDNNAFADAPVPAAQVQGKVVARIPRLGLLPVKLREWLEAATS